MPGMNGYQATRTIARDATTRSIPIIMLPASLRKPTRSGACARAHSTTMTKPVDHQALLERIRAIG